MQPGNVFNQLESEVRSYARSFPCVIDKARGTELRTTDGRRYLDFLKASPKAELPPPPAKS